MRSGLKEVALEWWVCWVKVRFLTHVFSPRWTLNRVETISDKCPMRLLRPHRIICDTVPAVKVGSQGTSLASLIQSWRLLGASKTVMHRVVMGRSVCTEPQCIKLTAVSSPKVPLCRIFSPLDTCMIRKPSISYRLVHTTLGSHCQNKVSPL